MFIAKNSNKTYIYLEENYIFSCDLPLSPTQNSRPTEVNQFELYFFQFFSTHINYAYDL